MRKSDRYTIEERVPSLELMHRAGKGIFDSVSWRGKTLIVCGKGNNAGDGYVVALLLKERGYCVELMLLDYSFSEDGKYYFDKCTEAKIPYSVYENQDLSGYDIILDCIFGTGLDKTVTGKAGELIKRINESGAYVVSADINSGLNGDNGLSSLCVKSDLTVSIGSIKSGHILSMAKDKIGKLVNRDIGIELKEKPFYLLEGKDVKEHLGKRASFSNKSTYGYVAIIGGSLEYSGAIKLSAIASGAVRSGSGVVKLLTPRSICYSVLPYVLESTLYPLSERDGAIEFNQEELDRGLIGIKAIAIGMGMGQRGDNERIISHILRSYDVPVIIDADGLNTLAKMDKEIVKNSRCRVVLTPHPKEMERLTKIPVDEILKSPIEHARAYAKEMGAVVLLKGNATVITDGETVYLTDTGCSGMATAGSGDVLSGILLSLCATGKDILKSVAVGSYINGYAGEIASGELCDIAMSAGNTARSVGLAISKLLKS